MIILSYHYSSLVFHQAVEVEHTLVYLMVSGSDLP